MPRAFYPGPNPGPRRPTVRIASLVAALACAAPAAAQAPQFLATVTATEVAVRSGPGDGMPETGTLPAGTTVIVHHEEPNGWLAIQPPRGSVSWVPFPCVRGVKPDAPFPQ